MATKIGWCFVNVEGTAGYPYPEKISLAKDPSVTNRGHFSCPAVRASAQGLFSIGSPFSLHLRFRKIKNVVSFVPVYPFTSINESMLAQLFRLEPREQWRSEHIPLFQIPSPYFFISDEPIEIEQCHPMFADSSSLNWRLIPGKFNIHGWQRPLNWAVEWDTRCGDLIIRAGEPMYYIRFYDESGKLIVSPDLVKTKLTEDLRERLNNAAGVTAFKRGTAALIRSASKDRSEPLLKS